MKSSRFPIAQTLLPAACFLGLAAAAQAAADLTLIGKPEVISGEAYAGGTVTVRYTLKNIGNAQAVASSTRLQIFAPLGTQFNDASFPIGAVAPGEQRTETHTISLKPDCWTAMWEVSVRLDTGGVVDENGVTFNNTTDRTLFHLTATRPDLTFSYGNQPVYQEYVPYASPAAYGGVLRVACDIKNESIAPAPASTVRVEIGADNGTFHVKDYINIPAIPPGGVVPFNFTSTLPATGSLTKKWSVTFYLDDNTKIVEASKFNNVCPSYYFFVQAAGTSVAPSPAPVGLANPRMEGGQFKFELGGQPGSPVTVQTSTDLINWSTQATPMIQQGVTQHSIAVGSGARYFRVR